MYLYQIDSHFVYAIIFNKYEQNLSIHNENKKGSSDITIIV